MSTCMVEVPLESADAVGVVWMRHHSGVTPANEQQLCSEMTMFACGLSSMGIAAAHAVEELWSLPAWLRQ